MQSKQQLGTLVEPWSRLADMDASRLAGHSGRWDASLPTFTRFASTVFCSPPLLFRQPHALYVYAQANGNTLALVQPLNLDEDAEHAPVRILRVGRRNRLRIARELLQANLVAFHDYVRILERNNALPEAGAIRSPSREEASAVTG